MFFDFSTSLVADSVFPAEFHCSVVDIGDQCDFRFDLFFSFVLVLVFVNEFVIFSFFTFSFSLTKITLSETPALRHVLTGACMLTDRSLEAANRPHREVTTKRVTSFTRSDRSDSPATDNHMDGKMPHGLFHCNSSLHCQSKLIVAVSATILQCWYQELHPACTSVTIACLSLDNFGSFSLTSGITRIARAMN